MSEPANGRTEPRARLVAVLALSLAALGVGGASAAHLSTAKPSAPPPFDLAPKTNAVSESWFCTGSSGESGSAATGTLVIFDPLDRAETGVVTVNNNQGASGVANISVRAHGETTLAMDSVITGQWLAARVNMVGGGALVDESVSGSTGWAEAPCATTTSSETLLAGGSTASPSELFLSMYNPTATVAVVDMNFFTVAGIDQPAPFQGLIIEPGQVVVANVGSYVQDQSDVAAQVLTQSGQIVASELEVHVGTGNSGLSLRPGQPVASAKWYLPLTTNVLGGVTAIDVANPGPHLARVAVDIELPSGRVAPIQETVGPYSVWTLRADRESRIPANVPFSAQVHSSVPVVVDRNYGAPAIAPAPQWGSTSAIASVDIARVDTYVLPGPGPANNLVYPGAALFSVAITNPGYHSITIHLMMTLDGQLVGVPNASVRTIGGGATLVLSSASLAHIGGHSLVITSTGPLAAAEQLVPAGGPDVITLNALLGL